MPMESAARAMLDAVGKRWLRWRRFGSYRDPRVTNLQSDKRIRLRSGKWLLGTLAAALLASVLWSPVVRGIHETRLFLNQRAGLAGLESNLRRKVCAHRANSRARFRLAGWLFDCIEIDVVLAPAVADAPSVYHPPDSNYRGLSLEQLLRHTSLPAGMLWLDVKDLAEDNWHVLNSLLHELVPAERRHTIVIETGWAEQAAAVAIDEFRRSGFQVSFYLPAEQAIGCAARKSGECNAFRAAVLKSMRLGFSHLSFDARSYEFVQTIRHELPESVRLLTWHTARSLPQAEMLDEVELYIVRFRTPFDR